jgi:WD40 repeat protein
VLTDVTKLRRTLENAQRPGATANYVSSVRTHRVLPKSRPHGTGELTSICCLPRRCGRPEGSIDIITGGADKLLNLWKYSGSRSVESTVIRVTSEHTAKICSVSGAGEHNANIIYSGGADKKVFGYDLAAMRVRLGFGRIVTLHGRSSTLYQIHEHNYAVPLFLKRQCDRTLGPPPTEIRRPC